MNAYTKNDKVTYISNWDRKGTFFFQQAVVVSCGKKQMALRCEETGTMMGRHFQPRVGDWETEHNWKDRSWTQWSEGGTFPRMTDAEAEAKCIEFAKRFLPTEEQRFTNLIKRSEESDDRFGEQYRAAMRTDMNELHAPRAHKKLEWTPSV